MYKLNPAITSYIALDDLHAMVELHHRIPSVTEALLTLHQNLDETKLGSVIYIQNIASACTYIHMEVF